MRIDYENVRNDRKYSDCLNNFAVAFRFFFTAVACCIKMHKFLIVSVVLYVYKGVCRQLAR